MFGFLPSLSRVELAAAIAAVALVAFGSWLLIHDRRVVTKERARVEKVGEKTNAKAQAKREAAESKPDLSRWYRD